VCAVIYAAGVVDLSTRQLRAFVVLAEELHFTRAATRLFVAQQALSRQIRDLETRLDAKLLDRTTRRVTLTPAGAAFLESARHALSVLDAGVDRAGRLSRGEAGVLRIGFQPGAALELTGPLLDAIRERHPDVAVELREFGFDEPSAGLVSGWADVALTRPPFSGDGLELEAVLTEPLLVAVRAGHPLTSVERVRVEDVLAEPIVVGRSADRRWQAHWTLEALRGGRPAPISMRTSSHTEEIDVVAAGVGLMVTPAASARFTPHPGVAYLAVEGLPRSVLAAGWRVGEDGPLVRSVLELLRETKARHPELVAVIEGRDAPAPADPARA
jgi:DNA-binding transcriptional LysR family regulator